jgi:hypothetical protein
MVIDNLKGNYRFIRAAGPFSLGCVAHHGFEIVHAMILPFASLAQGFELVERHLKQAGRPIDALCGMHLRIPQPLTPKGFEEFNHPYIGRLHAWGLEIGGANPVARTNVALAVEPLPEAMLAGFYYTIRSDGAYPRRATFVLSGAAEMRLDADGKRELVAPGDTSAAGIGRKLECVLEGLSGHLRELGLGWDLATAVNLYTVHQIHHTLASVLLPAIGAAARLGVSWHYSRPPVIGLELEIDTHAVCREVILAP